MFPLSIFGRVIAGSVAAALVVSLWILFAQASETQPANELGQLEQASAEKGYVRASVCRSCHKVEKDQDGGFGPNLWNVFNREKGSVPGYSYTKAMRNAGGQWDKQSLKQFLEQPKTLIPGTRMNFAGIPKEQDRLNIIAYLKTLSD
ncbi:MAG: cytochrome c family protein [Motiliproteus sp.]|nr:cytochrome c family protein [Motiliproteus sp.]MCW9050746.1 cytochrome c family protein [Motiliproteus sp.]